MLNNGNLYWDDKGNPILAVVACHLHLKQELMDELNMAVSNCLAKAGYKVQVSKESLSVTGKSKDELQN